LPSKRKRARVVSTEPLSPSDKALLAFGTQLYTDSVSRQVDYGKAMITLITSFFAAYFALLKFLGISDISSSLFQSLPDIWWAPVFFILSIIIFVVGVVLPFPQSISLNLLSDLRSARVRLMWIKYVSSLVATSLFICGLWFTLQISMALLR
jgi:hypothetical protein